MIHTPIEHVDSSKGQVYDGARIVVERISWLGAGDGDLGRCQQSNSLFSLSEVHEQYAINNTATNI